MSQDSQEATELKELATRARRLAGSMSGQDRDGLMRHADDLDAKAIEMEVRGSVQKV